MPNLLEQAINADDGERAAKIIQHALGIESDDAPCLPITPQMAAALSATALAFRDMAVGLRARLLKVGNDPITWLLIDEQLLFVSDECRTLADTAERWRCQGNVLPDEWLAFDNRTKAVLDKVSAWERALKVDESRSETRDTGLILFASMLAAAIAIGGLIFGMAIYGAV